MGFLEFSRIWWRAGFAYLTKSLLFVNPSSLDSAQVELPYTGSN
jgi:hypothetical protein